MTTIEADPRPVLVLALGNVLLQDDGVGLEVMRALEARCMDPRVEFVDGGTQGLALGGLLAEREAVLVLDAVRLGAAPGTVHHLDDPLRCAPPRGDGAHGANAGELFATALLMGHLPDRLAVVGIEPLSTRTGIGLSDAVAAALPPAVATAERVLHELLESCLEPCRPLL